jgi:hypothetical protein
MELTMNTFNYRNTTTQSQSSTNNEDRYNTLSAYDVKLAAHLAKQQPKLDTTNPFAKYL